MHILQQENLVENSVRQGSILLAKLRELIPRHSIIGDVRGLGLLCAVERVKNRETKEPIPDGPEINRLLEILAELGVLTRAESSNIYLAPPLCIQREQIDRLVTIVDTALSRFVRENQERKTGNGNGLQT
ncbi:MAG: aminotransferase class III-fold pyridoxal phosphate-dependent enzyme [Gammaproteobacteria bacterium]|nr:aminotransferase class III-fold pyridoxal phosphate-dependent enzyme [Gammaproteobacteria bacterium]